MLTAQFTPLWNRQTHTSWQPACLYISSAMVCSPELQSTAKAAQGMHLLRTAASVHCANKQL